MEVLLFMSDLSKQEQWKLHISHCEASGMSINQWCKDHKLSATQYRYWKKKFNLEDSTPLNQSTEWVSLNIASDTTIMQSQAPLLLKVKEYSIEINEGFSSQVLLDTLKVIGDLC